MSDIANQRLLDIANLMVYALSLNDFGVTEDDSYDGEAMLAFKTYCQRVTIRLCPSTPSGESWYDEAKLTVTLYLTENSNEMQFVLYASDPFFVINGRDACLTLHLQAMKEWEIDLQSPNVAIPATMMLRAIFAHLACPPDSSPDDQEEEED